MADRILYTKEDIVENVKLIADMIYDRRMNTERRDHQLVLLGNLNGCLFFMADLLRANKDLNDYCAIDFVRTELYGGRDNPGIAVNLAVKPKIGWEAMEGKHVIIIDDVLSSGASLDYVSTLLRAHNAAFVDICVLLDQPVKRKVDITPTYCGFSDVPPVWLYGYGMDETSENNRHLPDIWYKE